MSRRSACIKWLILDMHVLVVGPCNACLSFQFFRLNLVVLYHYTIFTIRQYSWHKSTNWPKPGKNYGNTILLTSVNRGGNWLMIITSQRHTRHTESVSLSPNRFHLPLNYMPFKIGNDCRQVGRGAAVKNHYYLVRQQHNHVKWARLKLFRHIKTAWWITSSLLATSRQDVSQTSQWWGGIHLIICLSCWNT